MKKSTANGHSTISKYMCTSTTPTTYEYYIDYKQFIWIFASRQVLEKVGEHSVIKSKNFCCGSKP